MTYHRKEWEYKMAKLVYDKDGRLIFTKEMKKEYTIFLPMMAKIHFSLIRNVFTHYGIATLDEN